jgi:hypothetical protein
MASRNPPADKTHKSSQKSSQKSPLPNPTSPDSAPSGDALAAMQTELLETFQEVNRTWLDHLQSEATLASEYVGKLSAARTIPETTKVCHEWATKRMEMAAKDAKRLLADGQKLAETGARFPSNGGVTNGGGST